MHYHNRISDKEYNLKINLKANLVDRTLRNVKLALITLIQNTIHM